MQGGSPLSVFNADLLNGIALAWGSITVCLRDTYACLVKQINHGRALETSQLYRLIPSAASMASEGALPEPGVWLCRKIAQKASSFILLPATFKCPGWSPGCPLMRAVKTKEYESAVRNCLYGYLVFSSHTVRAACFVAGNAVWWLLRYSCSVAGVPRRSQQGHVAAARGHVRASAGRLLPAGSP